MRRRATPQRGYNGVRDSERARRSLPARLASERGERASEDGESGLTPSGVTSVASYGSWLTTETSSTAKLTDDGGLLARRRRRRRRKRRRWERGLGPDTRKGLEMNYAGEGKDLPCGTHRRRSRIVEARREETRYRVRKVFNAVNMKKKIIIFRYFFKREIFSGGITR